MVKYAKAKKDKKYQLRKQISIFFILIIVFSIFAVYSLSNIFILDKFNYFIEKYGQDNMKLAINVLNSEITKLKNSSEDYSTWDDSYQFISTRDNEYINSNYLNQTFITNNWNLVYIFDNDRNMAYGKEFDLYKKEELSKTKEILDSLIHKDILFDNDKSSSEVIDSPRGKLIVVSYPILKSNGEGPAAGRFICGRYLDDKLIEAVASTSLMNLKIDNDIESINVIKSVHGETGNNLNASTWIEKSRGTYKSVADIYDSSNNKIITLVSNIDVGLLDMGRISMSKYIFTTSVILFVSFILLLFLINRTIFRRLNHLIDNVNNIEKNNDFSKRINIAYDDEIAILENGFNSLLSTVERTQSEILYQARYDQLTETLNRGAFFDKVQSILNTVKDKNTRSAMIFIDIDGFKDINDSLGHSTGDYILVNVSARLKQKLDEYNAVISRFGGDEFVTFIPNIKSYDEIEVLCRELLSKIKQPMYIGGKSCEITCSVGISMSPDHGDNVDDLINNADIAMYNVKKNNKNNFNIYNEEMRSRITLEMMQEALDNKEFMLYYQKQVDITTENVDGAEALIRWNSPEKGMISPVEFIPFAEETSFIVPLGKWILEEACRQCKIWNDTINNNFRVSVNVSSIQFMEKGFLDIVINTLESTKINPKNLELEITESVALYKEEEVISKLDELNKLGVRVSIDDFGTGYSSLKYLQKFKIDGLKIDKAFIDNINENSSIAKSIISMAENLGVYVIAEGVETIEQVNCLKELQCRYIQGYYYGKPVPPESFSLKSS